MGSNLDAPVIACKRGFMESLSFLLVLLLELLVVCRALAKGEPLYEVPVNLLRLPNATDEVQCGWRVIKYIKWLFGQKIYEGPPQIPIQQ